MKLFSVLMAGFILSFAFNAHAMQSCSDIYKLCKAACLEKNHDFTNTSKIGCATGCGNAQLGCDVAKLFPQWAQNSANNAIDGVENFLWAIVTPRNCGKDNTSQCEK